MAYRYYLTQRPPMPGSFPKPQGNKVLALKGFGTREPVAETGRSAWGYVEYERPLSKVLLADFEMIEGGKGND